MILDLNGRTSSVGSASLAGGRDDGGLFRSYDGIFFRSELTLAQHVEGFATAHNKLSNSMFANWPWYGNFLLSCPVGSPESGWNKGAFEIVHVLVQVPSLLPTNCMLCPSCHTSKTPEGRSATLRVHFWVGDGGKREGRGCFSFLFSFFFFLFSSFFFLFSFLDSKEKKSFSFFAFHFSSFFCVLDFFHFLVVVFHFFSLLIYDFFWNIFCFSFNFYYVEDFFIGLFLVMFLIFSIVSCFFMFPFFCNLRFFSFYFSCCFFCLCFFSFSFFWFFTFGQVKGNARRSRSRYAPKFSSFFFKWILRPWRSQ